MSTDYKIEYRDDIPIIRLGRTLGFQEMQSALDEVAAIVQTKPRIWVVTDHLELTGEQLKELSNRGKRNWPMSAKVAFVAANDLAFGLLRMYEVYRDAKTHNSRVFRDEEEALLWLKSEDD